MKRILLALIASAASIAAAHADPPKGTGMDLKKACEHPRTAAMNTDCGAFINGTTAGIIIGEHMAGGGNTVCLPSGITTDQVELIVRKFMEDHPEFLNEHSSEVVARALLSAYPCS